MTRIFRHLTKINGPDSSLFFDEAVFNEQLFQYEKLIYASPVDDNILLHCPSQRLKWLESDKKTLFQSLISGGVYLDYTLSVLEMAQEHLNKQRDHIITLKFWFGWLLDYDVSPTESSYSTIRESYYQLLKESLLVAQAVSKRLELWFKGDAEIRFQGKEHVAYGGQEQERAFFKACDIVSKIGRHHKKIKSELVVRREGKRWREG